MYVSKVQTYQRKRHSSQAFVITLSGRTAPKQNCNSRGQLEQQSNTFVSQGIQRHRTTAQVDTKPQSHGYSTTTTKCRSDHTG